MKIFCIKLYKKKLPIILTYVLGAQKNRLIETNENYKGTTATIFVSKRLKLKSL